MRSLICLVTMHLAIPAAYTLHDRAGEALGI